MCPKVSDEYKQQKKLEILRAARRVFIRKGFTRTVMQDIMEEAGMSRGAVYAYFGNVQHVFLEVLRYDDQEALRFLNRIRHIRYGSNCWTGSRNSRRTSR